VLYVSFHTGSNIHAYSLDGQLISAHVLNNDATGPLRELRGFVFTTSGMVVLNAYKKDSRIIRFTCHNEKLAFDSNLLKHGEIQRQGVLHPYAIVTDGSYAFVSNQDSETVLRFDLKTNHLSGFGSANRRVAPYNAVSPFEGTIAYFNYTGEHGNGVRSIALASTANLSVLFVAFQGNLRLTPPMKSQVFAIDASTGELLAQINAGHDATGLFWDGGNSQLYVGTHIIVGRPSTTETSTAAAVQKFRIRFHTQSSTNGQETPGSQGARLTARLMHTFTHSGNGAAPRQRESARNDGEGFAFSLTHAAGLYVHKGILWVANQVICGCTRAC
jgi:hypothetical protein